MEKVGGGDSKIRVSYAARDMGLQNQRHLILDPDYSLVYLDEWIGSIMF